MIKPAPQINVTPPFTGAGGWRSEDEHEADSQRSMETEEFCEKIVCIVRHFVDEMASKSEATI
jgi:hypothetical protein